MARGSWSESVRGLATWLSQASRMLVVGLGGLCLALGLVAAALGGRWNALGSGPGGLGGVPMLVLLLSALLGLPALALAGVDRMRGRSASWAALLLMFGPPLIAVYFFAVPHALDPCARGIWLPGSTLNSIPLCGRWGGGWDIHARFHLLLHAVPTLLPIAAYWKLTARSSQARTRAAAPGDNLAAQAPSASS